MSNVASQVYKKEKEMKKGIAFPTCLSINNCVCHFSPVRSEPDVLLKNGDVVKIDLGAHIDGFVAVAAYTTVVGASAEKPATGRAADAVLAAYNASQVAMRLLKPGNAVSFGRRGGFFQLNPIATMMKVIVARNESHCVYLQILISSATIAEYSRDENNFLIKIPECFPPQNQKVTEGVQKVTESFNCKPIEGMVSHQLKQFRIDGEKTIIQNPNDAQRKEHEKVDFAVNEVYAMDVLISTGEGVGKEGDTKVSIFKKTDEVYSLKLKAARNLYSEVKSKHGTMPFNLRHFDEEAKARMGVGECVAHKVIEPFSVLYEKPSK